MTTTIHVSPRQDFWQRLCRTRPLRAISEIVWNALDADAQRVSVVFQLNPLGGIQEITISDDGLGMPIDDDSEHPFAALGGSWKAKVQRTEKKRLMHGKFGEGRFRAFALGSIVSWQTAYRKNGSIFTYEITGSALAPGKFVLSDLKQSAQEKTGTIVSIQNPEPHDATLLSAEFSEHISRVFAPYLLNYRDIKLAIQDKEIETDEIVLKRQEFQLEPIVLADGQAIPATLEIVEWRSINGRALYLCDEDGFTLSERNPEIRAPGFNFGAYLKSCYFLQLDEGALVDLDLAEGMGHLLSAARARLAQYFRQREKEKAKALIELWKAEGVYPYPENAASGSADKARQVFDICAVTVHDYVEGFNDQAKTAKALSFRLLKEAIKSGSPELSRILSEVLLLPQSKQKEFSELLDKTKLIDIIDAVKDINHRISVTTGLRALVCGVEIRDSVKEREHIHKIVEAHPWIFGEQYAMGRSEASLTNMLREHLSLMKRDSRVRLIAISNG